MLKAELNKRRPDGRTVWTFPIRSRLIRPDQAVIEDADGNVLYTVFALHPAALATQVTELASMVANEVFNKTRDVDLAEYDQIDVEVFVEVTPKQKEQSGDTGVREQAAGVELPSEERSG